MSDNLEVYVPGTSTSTVIKQQIETVQETIQALPNLDSTTSLPLSELITKYTPRQVMLALGNAMYTSAQEQLNQAGDDSAKQQAAYLKLSQADRMRNLSVQF